MKLCVKLEALMMRLWETVAPISVKKIFDPPRQSLFTLEGEIIEND